MSNSTSNYSSATVATTVAMNKLSEWFSDESIEDVRDTIIEALYYGLIPGSLPSLCVYFVDNGLTILHFLVSMIITDDFTTTFLGIMYTPCLVLKLVYILEIFSSATIIQDISNALNQIFNMTIILGCLAYNIMCCFVHKYQKSVPLAVARSVFLPIFFFGSFIVIIPKLILNDLVDRCFQFSTQLFGSMFLIIQIAMNTYFYVIKNEKVEKIEKNEESVSDVVGNSIGRIKWASVFSFILVLFSIPQIVDYYIPQTTGLLSYHLLVQAIIQLNSLILSFTVFLVLPTYRSAILLVSKRKMKSGVEKIRFHNSMSHHQTNESSVVDMTEKKDKEKNEKILQTVHQPANQRHHFGFQFGQQMQKNPIPVSGHVRIFMTPTNKKHTLTLPGQ